MNLDWDDIRVFLAVTRATSLRQAADQLGVSHPTVRRRIDALEMRLGLKLFDRRPDGLHATPQAIELHAAAEEVEQAMAALGRRALDADPALRGPLRVTMPDLLATHLLMPDFAAFCRKWPQIDLHVQADYRIADLSRREADVAIRLMRHGQPPTDEVAGRLAATYSRAVYGRGDSWIGWEGAAGDAEWVRRSPFPDLPVRGGLNNPLLQRAACEAGMGLSILPCFLAEPGLERRSEPEPAYDIWVLVHPDLRRSPRLRIFRDEVVEALKRHRPRLEGRS